MNGQILLRRLLILGTPLILGSLEIFHPILHGTSYFNSIRPQAYWWITLHVLQLPLFCLIAFAAYMLSHDIHSVAAAISRIGLAIFVILYPAADGILGISAGSLVLHALKFPVDQQVIIAHVLNTSLFQDFLIRIVNRLGSLGWDVGLLALIIAFSKDSSSRNLLIFVTVVALLFTNLGALANAVGIYESISWISPPTPLWWIGISVLSVAIGFLVKPHVPMGLLALSAALFGTNHVFPYGPLGMLCFLLAVVQLELFQQRQLSVRIVEPEAMPEISVATRSD